MNICKQTVTPFKVQDGNSILANSPTDLGQLEIIGILVDVGSETMTVILT